MPRDDARSLATRRATVAVASLATVGLTLWMANRQPFAYGPLWGTWIALVAAIAWTGWAIAKPPRPTATVTWRDTAFGRLPGERISPLQSATLAVAVLIGGVAVGGYEALPWTILGALLCGAPVAIRRPGLAVILVISALYLPLLGTYTLMDPWETHYGEVAREILARNDWISLWWAQDKWFWSKPAFLFWAEAWTMGVTGVAFAPDANPTNPEWAVRLPTFVSAIVALSAVYLSGRRFFGPRAGAAAVLVVATMPQFFFVSHQAITDLPLVAAITVASCCLLAAAHEDPSSKVRTYRVGPVELSAQHVVLFLLVLFILPQATYLISRNISWIDGWHLVAHPDRFLYGSGGNLDVPGNPAPHDQLPRVGGLLGQPVLQGALWLAALGWIARVLRQERRRRALWMVGFYLACGIGLLAKGLLAIAIPGLTALLYLAATRRWRLLSAGELRIGFGSLVVLAVSLPWYLAMYVRHGTAFTNRLLIHDHINRLAAGVHGDKGTIAYFLEQVGYATFPWVALIPAALMIAWRHRSREGSDERADAVLFFGLWMTASFALFSAMVTKYHHYLLPALVPAGVLIGIAVAELWGPKRPRATLYAFSSAVCLVLGFAYLAGDPRGIVPPDAVPFDDWVLGQANPALGFSLLALALPFAVASRRSLTGATTSVPSESWSTALGVGAALGACLIALAGRDLSWVTQARPQGSERLIDLFIYNYDRAWPAHLDYRAMLIGFSITGTLVAVAAISRAWRPTAMRALVGIAIVFCAWGLDVYMLDVADHWGLKHLAARYYEDRGETDSPLIAWQMNWKGENFYTGNRVYVFAELDNERLQKWLADNEGRHAYVVLEHKRLAKFRTLMGDRQVEVLSTVRESNKFVLVALDI